MMEQQYNRLRIMLDEQQLTRLQNRCVAIVGLGGVGSFACESLARCGIKKLIIVDKDVVEASNINRQIPALHSTIGQAKTEVMSKRILDINPYCEVVALKIFLDESNFNQVLSQAPDFIIDACDTLATKLMIIETCLKRKIAFISSMGAANKADVSKIVISDLLKTYNDPLAKIIRSKMRKSKLKGKIPVVFSTELPQKPHDPALITDSLLGSNAFVPSIFGLFCANYCYHYLIKQKINL